MGSQQKTQRQNFLHLEGVKEHCDQSSIVMFVLTVSVCFANHVQPVTRQQPVICCRNQRSLLACSSQILRFHADICL